MMRKTAMVLLAMAAVFLVFAAVNLYGQVFGVHEPGSSYFPDVTVGTPGDEHIGWLYESEVTGGFPDETYRPTAYVTREEMAIYLARQRAVSFNDATVFMDMIFLGGQLYGHTAWELGCITLEELQENYERSDHVLMQAARLGEAGEISLPHASDGWWDGWAE